MIYSIIGLFLDIIGVLMLFKFGILPNKIWNSILQDNSLSEKDEKKYKLFSKVSISFIVIGFLFQLTGTILQNRNNNVGYTLENKILGKDCNETLGICGDLKLKYEDDKMFYFVSIDGKESILDSISDLTIELQDEDGFKIDEINEKNLIINPNKSYKKNKDKINLIFKSSINFTSKKYFQIKKWDLLGQLK
jgi:hypothetical protein